MTATRTARVGVLGGTFDPIHVGHIAVARAARDELGLDEVLVIPAARPPHKVGVSMAPAADRMAMVEGVPVRVRGDAMGDGRRCLRAERRDRHEREGGYFTKHRHSFARANVHRFLIAAGVYPNPGLLHVQAARTIIEPCDQRNREVRRRS